MGHTHALSAAGVFLAAAFPISHFVHHLGPAPTAIGTAVAAGAGLLPDLDHPSATAARAFGPISAAAARAVSAISGGHRKATHSLLGAGICGALAVAAYLTPWALGALMWLCIGLGARALWRRPRRRRRGKNTAGLIHAAAVAFLVWRLIASGTDLSVIPVAVFLGYLTHLAGDAMTESGVPWLYPDRRCYRIASIDTGKNVEKYLVVPALYAGITATLILTRGTWIPAIFDTLTHHHA